MIKADHRNQMENTLKKVFLVSSYEVDQRGKTRLTAIANYLQETAYKHAASLNVGYSHLAEEGRAWVLSRLRIKMYSYPKWDDTIEVETWPRGIEKLFALRDFRIRSAVGDLLAEATTCWLMVDMKTHRPMRINTDFIPVETRTDSVFQETPGKITSPKNPSFILSRIASYSDLDIVGHVNNVKFIEWCVDSLQVDQLLKRGISDFEINYLGEVRQGDSVDLLSGSNQNHTDHIIITGKNLNSDSECFRASIQFL